MTKIKQISYLAVFIATAPILLFISSCKRDWPSPTASSPWQKKSSDQPDSRYIIEMSEPDQVNCYGIVYDNVDYDIQDLAITHNGGVTWHKQTIPGIANNILYGLAATKANTVHVIGYNFANGGSTVSRTTDGGVTWQREATNTFLTAPSFANDIHFIDADNGVMLGDPQGGYFEIYTTCNGGDSWTRVPPKRIPAPLENEYGRAFLTDIYKNTIWTMASVFVNNTLTNSRLLQSDDKGLNWYVKNSSMPIGDGDGTLKFRNESVGLYKNNAILYRTTDGGTTFKVVNYKGTWFSFDLDNVPGKPGWWISTGGGDKTVWGSNAAKGAGSSISYDDGDHWITLDTEVNHTCVDMTSDTHGYSGGFATSLGNDGVFVYSYPAWHNDN